MMFESDGVKKMFYSDSAQYNIIVKKVLIEKILNDLGNECFMRGFKPNILILLSEGWQWAAWAGGG